jgi:hypothetical protein
MAQTTGTLHQILVLLRFTGRQYLHILFHVFPTLSHYNYILSHPSPQSFTLWIWWKTTPRRGGYFYLIATIVFHVSEKLCTVVFLKKRIFKITILLSFFIDSFILFLPYSRVSFELIYRMLIVFPAIHP